MNDLQIAVEKFNIGTRFLNKDQYRYAIDSYLEALKTINPYCLHCTGIDAAKELKGMILHSLGTCYFYLKEKDNAVKYAVQAMSIFESIGSDKAKRAESDFIRFKSSL